MLFISLKGAVNLLLYLGKMQLHLECFFLRISFSKQQIRCNLLRSFKY